MKKWMAVQLLVVTIFLYCMISSMSLIAVWWEAPWERYSILVFCLWLLPLILYGTWLRRGREHRWNEKALFLALVITLAGQLSSIDSLKYFGLAFAFAGMLPPLPVVYAWVIAAFSWMPLLGWLGSHYFTPIFWQVRFCLAAAGALMLTFYLWRRR